MADTPTSKQILHLDLNDVSNSAAICKALSSEVRLEILKALVERAMTISELAEHFYLPMSSMCLHVKLLKDAGLISVTPKPGVHGTQKLCGIRVEDVELNLFAHVQHMSRRPPYYFNMPVGHYSDCDVHPPCGIVSESSYLSIEDSPYGFYLSNHVEASLLWLSSGYLEYRFPNEALQWDDTETLELSFELCAEAPGYNNSWPSDINLYLNGHRVTVLNVRGDYGGRKGIYNPSWWSLSNTQYGDYFKIYITHDGCFMNNNKISNETIESLQLRNGYNFSMRLECDPNGERVGGMNLFGTHFGDYSQDIVMKVEYKTQL